ncbi:MAG TPA: serine/threonine-protein kinase [Gemmatimonadaceae bacterium]|nr:serine/threonine-protein kinase [Gemmatimonadaceae bacterium]
MIHSLTFAPQNPRDNPGGSPAGETRLEYAGAFRLVRKVATGGMATVYEAEQLGPAGFAKRIALKVIHPEFARRPEFLRLFIDEARLSANLLHGNIVQVYQLGEIGGDYFIAMEYIQGPTLRALIDRHRELGEPIPHTLAAYVASRVCRALDFAHHAVDAEGRRLEVVHRDVSPGNVMVTWDGHIKLGDFGIAKAATSVDPAGDGRVLLGKKHYISPEQALGLHVGQPSDVFSLGVVLFELLSLQPLFHEETTRLMIEEVAVEPLPPPRLFIPGLNPDLEQILMMTLDRRPERRSTAAATGQALDDWITGQQRPASPDQLQRHLARIFPTSYQPRTVLGGVPASGEQTTFSNLEGAIRHRSWLKRLGGWVRGR